MLAHYTFIVTMSLQLIIGMTSMMWENSKVNDTLIYVDILVTIIGLLILFFGR